MKASKFREIFATKWKKIHWKPQNHTSLVFFGNSCQGITAIQTLSSEDSSPRCQVRRFQDQCCTKRRRMREPLLEVLLVVFLNVSATALEILIFLFIAFQMGKVSKSKKFERSGYI